MVSNIALHIPGRSRHGQCTLPQHTHRRSEGNCGAVGSFPAFCFALNLVGKIVVAAVAALAIRPNFGNIRPNKPIGR